MNVIHKYELNGPVTMIDLPVGAEILDVQMQHDQMVLWACHSRDKAYMQQHQFFAVNTGSSFMFPGRMRRYIATITSSAGVVWHVFEVQE